jgi:chemotaxis methyl-accepting protein methylase
MQILNPIGFTSGLGRALSLANGSEAVSFAQHHQASWAASEWHAPWLNFNRFVQEWKVEGRSLPEQLEMYRTSAISGQTGFFRGCWLFTMGRDLMPLFPPDKALAISSVGCSCGAEPYSLLLQFWDQRHRLLLRGYDVNPLAIAMARKGEYDFWSRLRRKLEQLPMKQPEEAYYLRTVSENKTKFVLTDEARDCVQFEEWDVRFAPLPQHSDILLLFHVFMHYSEAGRGVVLRNVRASLEKGGLLLCEPPDPWYESGWGPYDHWMADLLSFGFECANDFGAGLAYRAYWAI